MKTLITKISLIILLFLGLSSCVNEYGADCTSNTPDPNTTILFLDMRSLSPSNATLPAEKIKTVRVIITAKSDAESGSDTPEEDVSSKNIIECNRLYELPVVDASNFSYTLTWSSTLGRKSVYVIANEEFIGNDLTAKLNEYEEMSASGDLEEWLEAYSFTPEYKISDNNIYLPYSYSKTDFIPLPGQVNSINCWLVPVATKFVFKFQNKRNADVRINGISMASVNSSSYLLPDIAPDAQYMEFDGESLYWPDWLAKVSQMSWNYPEFGENEGFNQLYGWITDYSVPDLSDSHVYTFVERNSSDVFDVPAAHEIETEDGKETVPGSFTTRIFYLPESINFDIPDASSTLDSGNDEDEQRNQSYYLTFELEDLGSGTAPKLENMLIPNLSSLFRNTFVVIQMVMVQGDIEIYAEIAPWNMKTANGWLSEGNAPSNNPFENK